MGKLANITGGVGLGVLLSQFPEYSQQYVQRLGGAVDELQTVVSDFDASAVASGSTRAQSLIAMSSGDEFVRRRGSDMTRTIDRFEALNSSYALLKDAGAYERLAYVRRFGDTQVTKNALSDFQPALPLNIDGLVLLFGGYIFGYGVMSGAGRVVRRRKKRIA
tara:strand:- start:15810 stop:16298 length:489 start_codon:yes stop_codon:yes gene_type:complete